jgi:hypothetical protein
VRASRAPLGAKSWTKKADGSVFDLASVNRSVQGSSLSALQYHRNEHNSRKDDCEAHHSDSENVVRVRKIGAVEEQKEAKARTHQ